MGTGLTRREQWAFIGVLVLIAGGLGAAAWLRMGREDARLVYIPGQGRWEKVADFAAEASTSATAAQSGVLKTEKDVSKTTGLDLNRATAAELERLPGIGAAKARAILEVRARTGGFTALEQLDTVPNIGAKTIERLRPFVTLTPATPAQASPRPPALTPASTPSPRTTPRPAPTAAATPTWGPVVDINRASAEQLEVLPGVGPVLARRIVEDRAAHGPYRTPRDLVRVQGIGPRNLEKMLPQIVAGPTRP